jgi:ABC-type phosphate transport system auxiliary subunit
VAAEENELASAAAAAAAAADPPAKVNKYRLQSVSKLSSDYERAMLERKQQKLVEAAAAEAATKEAARKEKLRPHHDESVIAHGFGRYLYFCCLVVPASVPLG